MQKQGIWNLCGQALGLLFCLMAAMAHAADTPLSTQDQPLQERFDIKYKGFLGTENQALLPFAQIVAQDWKKLRETRSLQQVFVEPDVFYNNKNYRFTMYQADDGNYYLDAKGGFWGMDELFYGPIDKSQLQ